MLTAPCVSGMLNVLSGQIRIAGSASPTEHKAPMGRAKQRGFPMSGRCGSPSGLPVPCGRSCTPASLGHQGASWGPGSFEHKDAAMHEKPLTFDEIIECLEKVDAAFHNLDGLISALTLISEDLQLTNRSPQNDAFWAIINAGRGFVSGGTTASDAAHRNVKRHFSC